MGSMGERCELDQNADIISGVDVFSSLSRERLKLLAFLSKRISFREGDFIFRQGDSDDRAYIIVYGSVHIMREYDSYSIIVSTVHKGDFFGGLALLSNISRLFSARATEATEVLLIESESFRKLMLQFPEMAIRVMDSMVKRITQFEDKLLKTHVPKSVVDKPEL